VTTVIGVVTMAIGLAYVGLGTISATEVLLLRRRRGVSRFGVGFTLMAASCGPHHVLHGWHALSGHDGGTLMGVATVVGLPSGLIFVALRIEALAGGRGDRFVSGTPRWLYALPLGFLLTTGALLDRAVGAAFADAPAAASAHAAHAAQASLAVPTAAAEVAGFDPTSLVFGSNLFVAVTYGLVGWMLLRTQVRRRPDAGGWSVSGLSLAGVFPTCALMHLVYAFTAVGHPHTTFFDVLGVPASVYFLWVVRSIHREAIVDWNRRPIVGRAGVPNRPSPWGARV